MVQVQVGGKAFPKKVDLREYLTHMRDKYQACVNKTVTDNDDDDFLRAFVKLHKQAESKIGDGIDHFEVREHPVWHTWGFWVIRTDDSAVPFSFNPIVTNL